MSKSKGGLSAREIVIFAMLGAILFIGDILMEWAPNVHPITVLVIVYTVVYRRKAIIPIIIYITLQAVFFGGLWLVPYCYIFPLYHFIALFIPKKLSGVKAQVCYSVLSVLFGLAFGILYAPWQAVMFMKTLDFGKIFAWVAAGFPYDVIHAVGNFAASFLAIPLIKLLNKIG